MTFNCGTIAGDQHSTSSRRRARSPSRSVTPSTTIPTRSCGRSGAASIPSGTKLSNAGGSVEVTEITRYPALRTPADDPWLQVVERIADAGPSTSIAFGTEGGLFADALDARW